MAEDRRPFTDELVRRLSLGAGVARRDGGTITVSRLYDDVDLDEPVIIETDEEGVRAAIEIPESARDRLWPGTDLTSAGFNLLLVNLDELIRTNRTPVRISAAGIQASEPPELDVPGEEGTEGWSLYAPGTGSSYRGGRKRRRRR